jgi:hypothetical protein
MIIWRGRVDLGIDKGNDWWLAIEPAAAKAVIKKKMNGSLFMVRAQPQTKAKKGIS